MARQNALLVALATFAITGCGDQGFRLPTGIGTGLGSSSTPGASINGTWRRTVVTQTMTDVLTSETIWVFSGGGGCQRTVTSESLVEGFPRTQVTPCSFSVASGRVTVRYSGSSSDVSFSVSISGNILFLNGQQFSRIG